MIRRSWRAAAAAAVCLLGLTGCGDETPLDMPAGFVEFALVPGDLAGGDHDVAVRLVGRGAVDSPFREDLCLVVGRPARPWPLPSAAASGYAPTLRLADVTGDGHPEILVVSGTGGSGGMVAGAVIAVARQGDRWDLRSLWDTESGACPSFAGNFADGFAAKLEVTAPGRRRQIVSLDLTPRRDHYVGSGVYAADGKLRQEVTIWGDGIMAVTPSAHPRGLRLVQQPRGHANADRLAEVRTVLTWHDGGWQAAEPEITLPTDGVSIQSRRSPEPATDN